MAHFYYYNYTPKLSLANNDEENNDTQEKILYTTSEENYMKDHRKMQYNYNIF